MATAYLPQLAVFPFAGFWSKDAVLSSVHDKIHAIEHETLNRGGHANSEHHQNDTDESPLASWSDSQLSTSKAVYQWLYYGAVLTAFLTAFYTFRAFALTFYGPLRVPPQAAHHAHESPGVMIPRRLDVSE